ncbi:MAG: CoA pyrophosphatase [Magnetococcales bacterium]|nr:CoA pyrophosphatase [Magnetococcales bacterium]NGZ05594.1 CoA pyrophosphatase [Magnetococcales bacterium]
MSGFALPAVTLELLHSCLNEKNGPIWQTPLGPPSVESGYPAAVIVPLMPGITGWDVLFIRRTLTVSHHQGQIAFPGGRTDPGDHSPEETALRELHEELGVDPTCMRILGRMPPTRTLQTGFLIHPFVGLLSADVMLQPAPDEVAETVILPLNFFLETVKLSGRVEQFVSPQGVVWGATARIMTQLCVAILTNLTCES